jgi:hypothetical protein
MHPLDIKSGAAQINCHRHSDSPQMKAAVLLSMVLLQGCASITGTTNQTVSVQTRETAGGEVSGAACELTNSKGKWFVTTPGSVGIHRSNDDIHVICRKDGFEPGRNSIVSETKGMMFGNILFGGGIGAIVDHNSGAAYEYPTLFQIMMRKLSSASLESNAEPQKTIGQPNPKIRNVSSNTSLEEQLRELKDLHEKGLISKENLIDRQKRLLEN